MQYGFPKNIVSCTFEINSLCCGKTRSRESGRDKQHTFRRGAWSVKHWLLMRKILSFAIRFGIELDLICFGEKILPFRSGKQKLRATRGLKRDAPEIKSWAGSILSPYETPFGKVLTTMLHLCEWRKGRGNRCREGRKRQQSVLDTLGSGYTTKNCKCHPLTSVSEVLLCWVKTGSLQLWLSKVVVICRWSWLRTKCELNSPWLTPEEQVCPSGCGLWYTIGSRRNCSSVGCDSQTQFRSLHTSLGSVL